MARHYLDFVGLNTFIYEVNGWDTSQQLIGSDIGYEYGNYNNSNVFVTVHQNFIGQNYGDAFVGDDLFRKRNYVFTSQNANLPSTASFFPALMLKRNGPYGFPTFKQIRISENPLSRRQRKENVLTIIEEPGPEIILDNNGATNTIRSKYGPILKYTENPVSSRYKPIIIGAATVVDENEIESFELVASYANETAFFNNLELNERYNKRPLRSPQYEQLSGYYLNDGLNDDASPLDAFEYLKYREGIYPPNIYSYKNYVRQRTTFSFPWRDDRDDRKERLSNNGFWSDVDASSSMESVWPLDAYSDWDTYIVDTIFDRWTYRYGKVANLSSTPSVTRDQADYGVLQNVYSFGASYLPSSGAFSVIGDALRVGPQYNRKHTLTISSSVVSPNGMAIEGINTGSSFGDINVFNGIPSGEAKWEAGSQSGLNPFYDTYNNYIDGVRQHGKDYSIVPEFRISEHVETYQSKGLSEEIDALFSLTGALSNTTDSSKADFYKIYSTSEFMKHFEIVKKDHKEFVDPISLTLKCKAVKKFLPYEGFYPAQRSVDLAKQFYSSYKNFVAVSGASNSFGLGSEAIYFFQNLMVPTFAPGVFFNSIKAGVACDYPLIDSNVTIAGNTVQQDGDDYYLEANSNTGETKLFNRRIPFEAVVEPEKHLADFRIYCNEPHLFANNSGSVIWNGEGDNLYKLMAQNFTAEVAEFFMKGKAFSSIVSKQSSDPNVGRAEANKTYMMRIKMYKSSEIGSIPTISSSARTYQAPQYNDGSRESFTMYSRPSAFGPPVGYGVAALGFYSGSAKGENYPFTPPYYHGQAWCDVTFTSTEARKYSIQEIIASSSIRQWRYVDDSNGDNHIITRHINGRRDDAEGEKGNSMPLNSSVNIFSQIEGRTIPDSNSGLVVPVLGETNDPPSRWVIQTKFETPMLNFNHLSASDSITLPQNASQSVPRGMWHQYGRIEESPDKGVFLQVTDVPSDWIDGYLRETSSTTGSLADLCGFSSEPVKLGQIADEKVLREAVVAAPFIEEDGERKFFRIPRIDIQRAKGDAEQKALVGESVIEMVEKMKHYVFPPPMDFMNNESIDPFVMYIFEFSHTLKKQDLANIWQNLYPEIGTNFETA
jgi:hypothetical protein